MADLEEHTLASLPDNCANCGATLTDQEKEAALERETTPVLCAICEDEQVPLAEVESEEAEAGS